jgi:hypothetical protein
MKPMRSKLLVLVLLVLAYLTGFLTAGAIPTATAQRQQASRFVSMGNDGPFRLWKDTRTGQCFIVSTPYFALLSVGPC